MARLRLLILACAAAALGTSTAAAGATLGVQDQTDKGIEEAGVCSRCHVISVVEWAYSGHRKAETRCVSCHGESKGHVIDERNNVKPERFPRGDAVVNLCATCHDSGCPETNRREACSTCHHYHALVDVRKPVAIRDERLEQLTLRWQRYDERMREGERLVAGRAWGAARAAFRAALDSKPGDPMAAARLKMCTRRLNPGLAGFEVVGKDPDEPTGLPKRVRVQELGTEMVLVPGGEIDIGSEQFPESTPIHTVHLAPFYVATREMTQAEWQSIMGANPSYHQGSDYRKSAQMPVESVSWEDIAVFLSKLNSLVAGSGFRLPSEVEWELAAVQGGEGGEVFNLEAPRPCGQGTPNKLGLFDLQGNVREWCSSSAVSYPYDQTDGRESSGGVALRILRGGAFMEPEGWYGPALRHSDRPGRRLPWNGFRLARSVPDAVADQAGKGQ